MWQPEFYLNVVRGLEEIAAAEVASRHGWGVAVRPGKVFFRFDAHLGILLHLRSGMNLFAFISERKRLPTDLSAEKCFEDIGRQLHLAPALGRHAALQPPPKLPAFRVTASRSGEHAYTSHDIASWVGAGLQAQTGWRVDLVNHDYEIEVEVVRDRALFGLHLGPSWRERRSKAAYHPASLNPSVAYAMLQLVGLDDDDVFLDPACGGATLLTERAALSPARLLLGGDIWGRALDFARINLDSTAARASLVRWDAGRLPLKAASVDRVASNLPFGHRISHRVAVRSFYRRLLPELVRVLRPGCHAALLTSRRRWLALALADNAQLSRERCLPIMLGGKRAFIFLLSRLR